MKVSKNTWHYTLFSMGEATFNYKNDYHVGSPRDLCHYMRRMVIGSLFSMLLILIGVILSILILDVPISTFLYFYTGNGLIPSISLPTFTIGVTIYIILTVGFTPWFLFDYLNLRIPKSVTKAVKNSGTLELISTGYKSFKDKTCVMIEVEK